MFSVARLPVPRFSLLYPYKERGAFVDSYCVDVDCPITQSQYIQAFYTTPVFKLERWLLGLVVSKPSTDQQVELLSEAKTPSFSAWVVEVQDHSQLLMCDYTGRTRSWLMVESVDRGTRLYFGSAVVPALDSPVDQVSGAKVKTGILFRGIQKFHHVYSMVLLASARSRLLAAAKKRGS